MSCVVLAIGVVLVTTKLIQQFKKDKEEVVEDVVIFMLEDDPKNDGEIIPEVCDSNDRP
tara:strand:+ start:1538 stop:1714 length:177 start_codon:yes stop_codon:yes gene_type:complete